VSLAVGSRLGAYEITGQLGAGGMGQVWRATDAALGRQVALKSLDEASARDPARLSRLDREARALAALNHPNIAAIYGIEQSGSTPALVMELVEGVTLADRIAQGRLPLDEALAIARQIIEALEAAHGQGIVHRDLKPANVMVRPDGMVKVLDFGLAKSLQSSEAAGLRLSEGATRSASPTEVGVILGTVAYMSPEQASGRSVDQRTDIWAFGLILFEMLSGRRAFAADSTAEVLAAVLRADPDWDLLPDVPPRIGMLMRACLQKDVRKRLAHAQDLRLALDGAFETTIAAAESASKPHSVIGPAVLVAVAAIAGALATMALWRPAASGTDGPIRFSQVLSPGLNFAYSGNNVFALARDGQRYAYLTNRGLYVRALSESDGRLVPGTEDPLVSPFFSPDGQSVGYFQGGQLKRLALGGGAPVVIASAPDPSGVDWAADGFIYYGDRRGIMRVSASGGTPALVIDANGGEQLDSPQLLPDNDTLLFSASRPSVFTQRNRWDTAEVVVQSLKTGTRKVVLPNGADARYVKSGHLVYSVEDGLNAVRFDPRTLETRGGPVSVLVGVARALTTASANYDVSDGGTLVYVVGAGAATRSPLTWIDRDGHTEAIPGIRPSFFRTPRLSADDQRVLVAADQDIRVYDLPNWRETRLTSDGRSGFPAWRADGAVAYTTSKSEREATTNVWLQPADGSAPRRLTALTGQVDVDSWSPDGRTLAVHHHKIDSDTDILMISVEDGTASDPRPFAAESADESGAVFSPDGRYVAYLSNETGRSEAYIVPFPGPGPKRPLSTGGAGDVVWGRSGEVFYRRGSDHALMAVPISTTPVLAVGQPRPLFQMAGLLYGVSAARYTVTRDGKRFLMNAGDLRVDDGGSAPRPAIQVVLNWRKELERLVP
jgi:serine/threonine protein kinase/Tol biopolymer transport system component